MQALQHADTLSTFDGSFNSFDCSGVVNLRNKVFQEPDDFNVFFIQQWI